MRESVSPKRRLELLTFCPRSKKNEVEFKILRIENPIECRIAERINRFVLKIRVRRDYYRAWINNTGRLHQFLVKGRKGFCVLNEKGGRTYYRLFSIKEGNFGAIIDTQLQMRVFEKSLEMKLVPWLKECRILKRNAKLGSLL